MRLFITLIVFLFAPICVFSQSEADNWFFGLGTGLNFNGAGIPSPQYGELSTLEGCASISDSSGNLLFYSDGSTVWARNHQVMPNGTGLLGDESSTQSAIIVPHPTLSNIYYLFTVGSTQIPSGYHYYEIDMNLNGGYGDVSGLAVDLSGDSDPSQWSEKITAVKGDTCDTVWVISLVRNLYYAYKVDENGVNPEPVISSVSFVAGSLSRGYLKISPNGKKLASAHQGINAQENGLYLYSFNNSTGEVMNDGITLIENTIQTYGVEFSSKSRKLYASTVDDEIYDLYQFDLTQSNILATKVLIRHEEPAFRGALQLGPDLKIYATIPRAYTVGTNYLDVIHYPELDGIACNFEEDYIFVGADNFVMQGLPPFIQSFFYEDEINIVNPTEPVSPQSSELEVCFGASYTLEGEDIPGADYQWTFDNGSSTVDLPTPSPPHQLTINSFGDNISGLYTLHVNTHDACNTLLIGEANVSFTNPPIVNPWASISSCDLFDDNSNDGLTTFNLEDGLFEIIGGNPSGYDVFFFLNDVDAENDLYNENALPQFYSNVVPNQVVTAKVYKSDSKCYTLSQMELTVDPGNLINSIDLSGCISDDSNTYIFDLNAQLNDIVALNSLPASVTITFYGNIEDAVNNVNPISGNYESEGGQVYFYASEGGNCYGSGHFALVLNPLPPIDIEEEIIIICNSDFPAIISSSIPSTSIINYDYYWSSGEISESIFIFYPQTVSVRVVDRLTFCETIKTYIIQGTEPPIVSGIETNINTGTVTIFTTENINNLYAINDPDGVYQTENVFTNVPPGIHTIYVKNANGCGVTAREIHVLGFPKYFTPNDDNINDTWQIKGVDSDGTYISEIFIFDRYGKLLKILGPENGWDGTYNGQKMPASDYWFYVEIEDKNNVIRTFNGYFSLVI